MTLNLYVSNTTQVSGTWRLRTPSRNSWLKLDENALDQTLDECVISMKNATEVSSDVTKLTLPTIALFANLIRRSKFCQ
jgi:poly(A) polymerase Pap1